MNPDDVSLVQNRRQAAISRRASMKQALELPLREYDGFEDGAAVSWSTFASKQRPFATILEDCECVLHETYENLLKDPGPK